jgi:hypothetical protein
VPQLLVAGRGPPAEATRLIRRCVRGVVNGKDRSLARSPSLHGLRRRLRADLVRPLRRYDEIVRLLGDVHAGRAAIRPSPAVPRPQDEGVSEVSRFSRMEFPHLLRVFDSAALPDDSLLTSSGILPSPFAAQGRHADAGDFGARWLACVCPCRTLHPRPRGRRRMTRGLDGSLLLSSAALSSATPCRFSSRRFRCVPFFSQPYLPGMVRGLPVLQVVGTVDVDPVEIAGLAGQTGTLNCCKNN